MNQRTQKERMLAGELYVADDPELAADNRRISAWMARYNAAMAVTPAERHALLVEGSVHHFDQIRNLAGADCAETDACVPRMVSAAAARPGRCRQKTNLLHIISSYSGLNS